VDVALLEEDAQDLIFARVVSKLREHLERRDLGVRHVVVFVDELNKYAPGDGPDTYVRKMLLDIAERGRYLGLVLFGAEQFRSQVHRRVVGNSGTALFGRMDADELATPGYAVLSPAIRTKLATLAKGQLMVRHPHFTQPVFVTFPRPPVMRGRDGVERYPQAAEASLDAAIVRSLRRLDPTITLAWVQDIIGLHEPDAVIRARNMTLQTRPQDVKAFFARQFRTIIPSRRVAPAEKIPIRSLPDDDPYAF
jgi:DNA helicase HerA-like ATPase